MKCEAGCTLLFRFIVEDPSEISDEEPLVLNVDTVESIEDK